MRYQLSEIAEITGGRLLGEDALCLHPLTDSRRTSGRRGECFFALKGERHDGHSHIQELFDQGVRAFIVSEENMLPKGASAVIVDDGLKAIQSLASHHRKGFKGIMIAITGSVGKTVVKEMAFRALSGQFDAYRSPGSYNSQLGVALSLLGLEAHHELAIIEAGISQKGEMARLAQMIRPDIGVFTALTSEHEAGFADKREKMKEKLTLFQHCDRLLFCSDDALVDEVIRTEIAHDRLLDWGRKESAAVHIVASETQAISQSITYCTGGKSHTVRIPKTDMYEVDNALTLISLMGLLGLDTPEIHDRMVGAVRVAHRTELTHCRWGSSLLVNQSPIDAETLRTSLDTLQMNAQGRGQVFILTADPMRGVANSDRIKRIGEVLGLYPEAEVVLIGHTLGELASVLGEAQHFDSSAQFIAATSKERLTDKAILLKGAWSPDLLSIRERVKESTHRTVMTVDMEALVHNLNAFRAVLDPGVELMVMVKAFSYGSGDAEIAQLLAFHGADRLAVAYADEGVTLREKGIELPIMVMNWGVDDLENMFEYQLEPEVFSHSGLSLIKDHLSANEGTRISIHLKVDTGMNRLGLSVTEALEVWPEMNRIDALRVASVFTHLLASDDPAQEEKTQKQLSSFENLRKKIRQSGGEKVLFHCLNTGGILRYPNYQFDMVRLGIGLYGHSSVSDRVALETALSLSTVISQVRQVCAGETVGYGGQFTLESDCKIAVLPIGYADGLSRRLGNGVGGVFINGQKAPFVGNICMDMCMVDVTSLKCSEGDEVEVFGKQLPIENVAQQMGTIVYEVLVGISQRVRRNWVV